MKLLEFASCGVAGASVSVAVPVCFDCRRGGFDWKTALMHKTHQVPSAVMDLALTAIFTAETPLGHWLRFSLGISSLGVFRK